MPGLPAPREKIMRRASPAQKRKNRRPKRSKRLGKDTEEKE